MDEIWKDIKGFEGLYQVSNLGRVKSIRAAYNRFLNGKSIIVPIKERILSQVQNKHGYKWLHLSKNGKQYFSQIHRLVALNFIDNPFNKPLVDHINTDKTDNRVENLRWVTPYENCYNIITRKRHLAKCGKSEYHQRMSKVILQLDDLGHVIKEYPSMSSVKKGGFDIASVRRCCLGKKKHHHGYRFLYK